MVTHQLLLALGSEIYAIILTLLGAGITTIFVDEAFIPIYDSIKEYLKTNEKVPGKFYKFINNQLASWFMKDESKMIYPLKKKGDEYRIYVIDGKVHCRRSHISELKQIGSNKFRGQINRYNVTSKEKSINDFKGHIKKNADYLVFEEYKKGKQKESNYLSTAYYYFPDNKKSKEVIGIAIENDQAQVQNSISILSFGNTRTYGNTSGVLEVVDNTYLKKFNIDPLNKNIIDETIYHADQ
jgi:hypothetical protein